MTDPDTAALAEQVREAIHWQLYPDKPLAALTTLVERLEDAERHEGDHSDAICDLKEHLEAAERERDEEALRVMRTENQRDEAEELAEARESEAGNHEARAEAAEAEVGRLREALTLTYASIDNLCARPGTCMAVRPRTALRDTVSGK